MTHDDNMPLGDINVFRSNYYAQFIKERYESLQHDLYQNTKNPGAKINSVPQIDFGLFPLP